MLHFRSSAVPAPFRTSVRKTRHHEYVPVIHHVIVFSHEPKAKQTGVEKIIKILQAYIPDFIYVSNYYEDYFCSSQKTILNIFTPYLTFFYSEQVLIKNGRKIRLL